MKYTTYNRKMNGASQLCLIVAMLLATQSFSQNKIIIHATGVANSGVDSIWRTAGIDSIFYSIGANTYKIKDSAVGADTNFAINDLTLTGDRTHTFGGYKMTFTGSHTYAANQGMFKVLNSGTGVAIYASNTSAAGATIYGQGGAYGVQGQVTSGRGVYGFATTGIGVVGYSSSSGTGVYAQSSTGTPLLATSNGTGINTVNTGIYVLKQHNSPGTVDDGIGVSIDMAASTNSNSNTLANRLISQWTTAAHASRTSKLTITGVDNTTTKDIQYNYGNGDLELPQNPSGIILTDTVTGTRYRATIASGAWVLTAL